MAKTKIRTNEQERHLRLFQELVDEQEDYILIFRGDEGLLQVFYNYDGEEQFKKEVLNVICGKYKQGVVEK